MFAYIVYSLSIFFMVLDVIVLIYLIRNWLPFGPFMKYVIDMLMYPMLAPMQKLVQHSILNCFRMDISPYILLIVLSYLQGICSYLLK